jgi:hypothetical protein
MIANRALSTVGTPYDLLRANCEQVAAYAETASPDSPQLNTVVGFIILGLAASFCRQSLNSSSQERGVKLPP